MGSVNRRKWRDRHRQIAGLFIAWHLVAVTLWQLPASALVERFQPYVRPYMTLTDFLQNWAMFAPNPSHAEIYLEARVTDAAGRTHSWDFPRMSRTPFGRYRRERFRKLVEVGHLDSTAIVWPALARYAARANDADPHDPPVFVELVRHFRFVPPPGQPDQGYHAYTFYRTPVRPGDLR